MLLSRLAGFWPRFVERYRWFQVLWWIAIVIVVVGSLLPERELTQVMAHPARHQRQAAALRGLPGPGNSCGIGPSTFEKRSRAGLVHDPARHRPGVCPGLVTGPNPGRVRCAGKRLRRVLRHSLHRPDQGRRPESREQVGPGPAFPRSTVVRLWSVPAWSGEHGVTGRDGDPSCAAWPDSET